jgi:hypothetical protein
LEKCRSEREGRGRGRRIAQKHTSAPNYYDRIFLLSFWKPFKIANNLEELITLFKQGPRSYNCSYSNFDKNNGSCFIFEKQMSNLK